MLGKNIETEMEDRRQDWRSKILRDFAKAEHKVYTIWSWQQQIGV